MNALSALKQRIVDRYLSAKERPYAAVFLDPRSQQVLLRWWETSVGIPIFSDVKAHHVTLAFNPSLEKQRWVPVGIKVGVRVVGWAADDKGQAVLVRCPIPCDNRYPHVTVAVSPGVQAVYSNELLARGVTHRSGPTLFGVVDIRTD